MTKVVTNSTNTNTVIVSVNDIFSTTIGDSLQINLKNPNLNYSISPTSIKATSTTNYVWYGEFNNDDYGYMMLIKEGDDVYGQVSINGNNYNIDALGGGISAISKKAALNPLNGCTVKNTTSTILPPTGTTYNNPCTNNSVTKILFLYTSGASNAVPNISQRANACIQQFKTILNNSQITPTQVDVIVATSSPILYNDNIIEANQSKLDAFVGDATVQNLRDQYNADIVVLLFKLPGNTGGTYGIANIGSNANNAYFMVDVDAAVNPESLTFSHEIGHLYGGRHEYTCISGNTQCDNTNDQYHAFIGEWRKNFWSPYVKVKTAMYSGDGNTGADRIMYYSNPDVKYPNKRKIAIGSIDRENVAKKIRDRGFEVAAFRPEGYLVAIINGTDIFDPGYIYNWNAQVNCGIQPYTYEWRVSTNGGTYSLPVSTYSNLTYTMPNSPAFYIWLRVTSADGQVVNAYKRVTNRANLKYVEEPTPISNMLIENELNPYLKIYPNPANIYTTLNLTIPSQSKVLINFYNEIGQPIETLNYGLLDKGVHTKRMELNKFTAGMYIYEIILNGKATYGKLIVTL
jgi:hypothetical protein